MLHVDVPTKKSWAITDRKAKMAAAVVSAVRIKLLERTTNSAPEAKMTTPQ